MYSPQLCDGVMTTWKLAGTEKICCSESVLQGVCPYLPPPTVLLCVVVPSRYPPPHRLAPGGRSATSQRPVRRSLCRQR